MKVFSELFQETTTVKVEEYERFLDRARNTFFFDEARIADLVVFVNSLYYGRKSLIRQIMSKEEFLNKIAELLNYVDTEKIILLRAYEILELFSAEDFYEKLSYMI